MGQAPSHVTPPPPRDWVVTLKPGTTQQAHQALMAEMNEAGNYIGVVLYPNPLGFALHLAEGADVSKLRSHPDVLSVEVDDPSVKAAQAEFDNDGFWGLLCGANRRAPAIHVEALVLDPPTQKQHSPRLNRAVAGG